MKAAANTSHLRGVVTQGNRLAKGTHLGHRLGAALAGQLGPDGLPVVRAQLLAGDTLARLPLNGDRYGGITRAEPVAHIAEMTNGRTNTICKRGAIIWCKRLEVVSQFHDRIAPEGVVRVNTFRCHAGDLVTGWLKAC